MSTFMGSVALFTCMVTIIGDGLGPGKWNREYVSSVSSVTWWVDHDRDVLLLVGSFLCLLRQTFTRCFFLPQW